MGGDLFCRKLVHIAEEQGGTFARCENREPRLKQLPAFFAQHFGFGASGAADVQALRHLV